MSWDLVKRCTVKIANYDRKVGTGFFISSEGHLLTCVHVVEAAGGWQQVRVNGQEVSLVYLGDRITNDFAVLKVSNYQGETVPLSADFKSLDRFLTFGFGRKDFPNGATIEGTITDENSYSRYSDLSVLRLRVKADSQRVEGGYSGSPIFDVETEAVVGIMVACDKTQGAIAVPLSTVQAKWSELDQFIKPRIIPTVEPVSQSKRVFISYRTQDPDLSLAQTFYERLKQEGHQPFMASESIQLGENWAERIDQELEQCDYFLLLLSPNSANSEMVTEEVRWAKELQNNRAQQKPIILPIRVNCPPDLRLNYDLRAYLQRIQYQTWNSEADTQVIFEKILTLLSSGNAPNLIPEKEVETVTPVIETPDILPSPIADPELLREPTGTVFLQSSLYVERSKVKSGLTIESDCYQEIQQSGSLIRIKAPRQMGKTSLMVRILNHAQQQNYKTIFLNFQVAESQVFKDLQQFFRWFCEEVGSELECEEELDNYWTKSSSKTNCRNYFKECLLNKIQVPLVLALDEVDRIFPYPQVAGEFLGLLRVFNESSRSGDSNSELWEKLRLIIVHSTEDYVTLDLNQSPFNVGKKVDLPEFNTKQVEDLIERYELAYTNNQRQELMKLVGGHPYLIRKALYHLRIQDLTFNELLKTAPTNAGIYNDHLRRHLLNLQKSPRLMKILREIVTKNRPLEIDSTLEFKLDSMGLIKREGDQVIPRCDLYRLYFSKHL